MGEERFLERMRAFFENKFLEYRDVSDTTHRRRTRALMSRARDYGLETEVQIASYLVTAWIAGEDFDTARRTASMILSSSDHTPEQKTKRLIQWAESISAPRGGRD